MDHQDTTPIKDAIETSKKQIAPGRNRPTDVASFHPDGAPTTNDMTPVVETLGRIKDSFEFPSTATTENDSSVFEENIMEFVRFGNEGLGEELKNLRSDLRYTDPFRLELETKRKLLLAEHSELRTEATALLRKMQNLSETLAAVSSTINALPIK